MLAFNFLFAIPSSPKCLFSKPNLSQYFVKNCFLWFNELYHRYSHIFPALCFAFNLHIDNSYIGVINGFEYECYDHVEKTKQTKQLNPCETSAGVSRIVSKPTKRRIVKYFALLYQEVF